MRGETRKGTGIMAAYKIEETHQGIDDSERTRLIESLSNALQSAVKLSVVKIDLGLLALGSIINDTRSMTMNEDERTRLIETLQSIHNHILHEVEYLKDHYAMKGVNDVQ